MFYILSVELVSEVVCAYLFSYFISIIEESTENDLQTLCIGTDNGVIYVWLVPKPSKKLHEKPKILHILGGHMHSAVTSLAVHGDGVLLASGEHN